MTIHMVTDTGSEHCKVLRTTPRLIPRPLDPSACLAPIATHIHCDPRDGRLPRLERVHDPLADKGSVKLRLAARLQRQVNARGQRHRVVVEPGRVGFLGRPENDEGKGGSVEVVRVGEARGGEERGNDYVLVGTTAQQVLTAYGRR